jgi:alanine dehydrogenase
MIIGVPRELAPDEKRVGLAPAAALTLARQGHDVLVERDAGLGSGFTDEDYRKVGGRIAGDTEEVYRRAGLLVKVQAPTAAEAAWLSEGQTLLGFLMLPACEPGLLGALRRGGCSAVDTAAITCEDGSAPVLASMSRIAGRIVPQLAARYLQSDHGGSGILLGGLAGVPPAEAVVLGGGIAGRNAARALLGCGARVTLLDVDVELLHDLHWRFEGRVTTYPANEYTLAKVLRFADVVVGAVRSPGGRAPVLVDRQLEDRVRDGSVVIDLAIDQGGCFAASRPTRLSDPVYVVDGVTHFCAPNTPSLVARTATHALGNALLGTVVLIAAGGLPAAMAADPALARGVGLIDGRVVDPRVAGAHGLPLEGHQSGGKP